MSEYIQEIDITENSACQAVTLGTVANLKPAVCTEKYFSACKVNTNQTFYLRGLCENTFFDTEYRPLMVFDKVAWIGLQGSIIWFSATNNNWNIIKLKYTNDG